ncbi:transcriptional regulator [Thiocystis minor]|uniref:helix-turn-helix domain-containing protein n=1 Tax=Thiocystis minor TaxID=61597 RepID=UPI0019135717|nr:helix-turn-helix transcriptional regulator [Thiocystis minor]MBK5962582.1 transcriptional regulator [Thiocystis minor]
MTKISDLHQEWMRDPEYQAAYDVLNKEFTLAAALIDARARAGLTQEELAQRMETTQSVIAQMEGGRVMPTTRTLEKIAKATGSRLKISFKPKPVQCACRIRGKVSGQIS